MRLHENTKLFKEAISYTAQQLHIKDIYIEKDYWVTFVLYQLYHSELKNEIVFKGGTALSKCHRIIERFSEDIDLILIKNEKQSDHTLKNKLRNITKEVQKHLQEVEVEGISHRMGMVRKTAHEYPKAFKGDFGQVRDTVIVEATRLGHHEPYEEKIVSSYIYDMMLKQNQTSMIEEYQLHPFNVYSLNINRTLCEKIMSLVRFSYGENPIEDLNSKIRHVYDIHKLLQQKTVQDFFSSSEFDKMLDNVVEHDKISFKNNSDYLNQHPTEAIIFSQLDETWAKLSITYNGAFKSLVYGDFPPEKDILKTLKLVINRLKQINW